MGACRVVSTPSVPEALLSLPDVPKPCRARSRFRKQQTRIFGPVFNPLCDRCSTSGITGRTAPQLVFLPGDPVIADWPRVARTAGMVGPKFLGFRKKP